MIARPKVAGAWVADGLRGSDAVAEHHLAACVETSLALRPREHEHDIGYF